MDSSVKGLTQALWPKGTTIPTRDLRCRACRRENEVQLSSAVLEPASCECGACGAALFLRPDEAMRGLPSASYQHPLDARSLAALKAVPGFDRVVKWVLEQVLDRTARLQLMGSALRCGEDQLPGLHARFQDARARLGMEHPITLYLTQSAVLNAYTSGVEERVVVVHSSLVNELDDAALTALFGHELGHQHAEHLLYRAVAGVLITGGNMLGPLRMFSFPLQLALSKWSRCAELTSDRAALLASRDLGATIRLLLTLTAGTGPRIDKKKSELDLGAFIRQARQLAEMEGASAMDGIVSALMTMKQSHPFPAWRLMHLIQWVEQGNYLDLLAGDWPGSPSKRAPKLVA